MHMVTVMIVGLAMGSMVCIGQAVGAGDRNGVRQYVGNTAMLFSMFALAATAGVALGMTLAQAVSVGAALWMLPRGAGDVTITRRDF